MSEEDFSFPTAQELAISNQEQYHHQYYRHVFHLPLPPAASSLWLLSSPDTTPIRRSFSTADGGISTGGSPLRANIVFKRDPGACSPALSDYVARFSGIGGEDEERMDSLWEDFNNEELFLGSLDVSEKISRRRSVGSELVGRRRTSAPDVETAHAAVLGGSKSARRKKPSLVVVMRMLKNLFVAQKSKSKDKASSCRK